MPEALSDALKFRQWQQALERNGIDLQDFTELHTVRKADGSVLFALLHARMQPPDAPALPPVVLLRGHFVSVLTCLSEAETGRRYLLLVSQRRGADGSWFLEHPSGMCDSTTDPREVALHEFAEETGLEAHRSELIALHAEPYYSSPGLLDEAGWFFALRRTLPAAELAALDGRLTGNAGEHEHIRLRVLPYAEGRHRLRSGMARLNCCLFEEWEAAQP